MKIEREFIGAMDIAAFADQHGLVMTVKERPTDGRERFYALFKKVEIIHGGCLINACGNGATEDEAIESYAKTISLKRIAVGAYTDNRVNLTVPRLHYTPSEQA